MTEQPPDPGNRWPTGLARPRVVLTHSPYHVESDVVQALGDQTQGHFEVLEITEGDPYDYGRKLASVWPSDRTLITLDMDVLPAPGVIEDLACCGEPWCAVFISHSGGHPVHGLGFSKFSASFQRRHPVLMHAATRLGRHGQDYTVPADVLDVMFEAAAARIQIPRHHHTGARRIESGGE